MLGLISLPYEVLANIIGNVDFDDVFNLARTCRSFMFLITEESLCKKIVQSKIAFSSEAIKANSVPGGYASALRGIAKRRHALANVDPFTVATVGFCDAYLYCKGVLCYTLDDKVRVLDLHNSREQEIVFSIPELLNQALSNVGDSMSGNFQILYYSNAIISCIYRCSSSIQTAWLISFSLKKRKKPILLVRELDSTEKLFVRHNDEYLYYGTHSEIDADGHKKWMIYGYKFSKRQWFDEKIYLSEMAGSDIGSSICFEFYQDYFYALSNQTSFEVEEIDWTSFYHCIRFPLDSPCKALMEKTQDRDMWRRQHQEGPIDERWMSLQLVVDESSGELKIVESRKEWYLGSSRSQRNYYTSDIIFPELEDSDDDNPDSAGDDCMDFDSDNLAQVLARSRNDCGLPSTSAASSSHAAANDRAHGLFENSGVSNSQLLRLIKKNNNPHYLEAPPRLPQQTHPGDDGSAQRTFTLAKTRIRTYHLGCSTFLDLVDDPVVTDYHGTQRLRLRGGSRRLGPPLKDENDLLRPPSDHLQTAIKELYVVNDVEYWPRTQTSDDEESLGNKIDHDQIYKLLNPPTHLGYVEGTADDRSLVYVTGAKDKPRALIFVSFDAATRLKGLRRYGHVEKKKQGVGEGPHVDGRATACNINVSTTENERNRTVTLGEKGKSTETEDYGPEIIISSTNSQSTQVTATEVHSSYAATCDNSSSKTQTEKAAWAWRENAMYQDIGLGYNFGLARKMNV